MSKSAFSDDTTPSDTQPTSPPAEVDDSPRHTVLLPAILVVAAFGLYSRTVNYAFTNWDDIQFLLQNPLLKAPVKDALVGFFTPGGVPGDMLYTPLTYVTFLFDRVTLGLEPRVVHMTNVILHAANAVLAFYIFTRLQLARSVAFIIALAFVVHPLQVEAVAWAMGRKDLVSAFLGLATMLAYLYDRETRSAAGFSAVFVLAVAAFLAKPSMLILPVLLLIFDWHLSGSIARRDWLNKLPILGAGIAIYGVNLLVESGADPSAPSMLFRLAVIPTMALDWGARTMLVAPFVPLYPWPATIDPMLTAGGVIVLVVLVAGAFQCWRRQWRGSVAALAFTAISFLPAVAVMTLSYRDFVTADRYAYIALLGVFWTFATLAQRLTGRALTVYAVILCGWLAIAALLSHRQIAVWEDSTSIWSTVVHRFPNSTLARSNLGLGLIERNDLSAAAEQFRAGLLIDPDYVPIYLNLGRLLLQQNQPDLALKAFSSALVRQPDNARAHNGTGDALLQQGELASAVVAFQRAIELKPNYAAAFAGLGHTRFRQKQYDDAKAAYRDAIAVSPFVAENHFNLGIVYERQNADAMAAAAYKQAIHWQPDYVEAHYNLAHLNERRQAYTDAEAGYRQVLVWAPENVEAMINLANVYLRTQRPQQAEVLYRRALELAPGRYPFVHLNLARIYVNRGNLAAATQHFETAVSYGLSDDAVRQRLNPPRSANETD